MDKTFKKFVKYEIQRDSNPAYQEKIWPGRGKRICLKKVINLKNLSLKCG